MKQLLRPCALFLVLLPLAGNSLLQGQDSLQQDGLVNGKRELVCPHQSADALTSFVALKRSEDSNFPENLYSHSSFGSSLFGSRPNIRSLTSAWAYLDIGSASVPTLMPDGNTLDFDHENNVDMVAYWKPDGSVEKSFWARVFDRGRIVTSGTNLVKQGVDDLSEISAEVKTKKFAFVQGELATEGHLKDLVWTNTIFVDRYNTPQSKNLDSFRKINEQLLDSIRGPEFRELANEGVTVATTVKTDSGEQILTVFVPDQSAAAGHLVGYLHLLDSDPSKNEAAVNAWFADMKPGTRAYICGDDVSVDFNKLAEPHGVSVIRRGPNVVRDILQTDLALKTISARGLKPETTSVLNGIPSTKSALESMGKPIGGLDEWNAFHTEVEQAISGRYSRRIETKSQLYEELMNGQADVLLLVAHFDGNALYFGNEKASFDEINALKDRKLGGRPRTAVLIACDTGKLSSEERSFFRKQVKSMGELFVKKGFFDQVIAPQHEIQGGESMSALTGYLKDTRVRQDGWVTLAENSERTSSGEILQQP